MDGFKGYMDYLSWCLFINIKIISSLNGQQWGKMCKNYIKHGMTKDKWNKGEDSYTTGQQ